MSPGDLAMGFVILLAVYGVTLAVVVQSHSDARPHRDRIHWQECGLTDAHLDEQWIRREHEQGQRQVTLDATQRVLGRLVR